MTIETTSNVEIKCAQIPSSVFVPLLGFPLKFQFNYYNLSYMPTNNREKWIEDNGKMVMSCKKKFQIIICNIIGIIRI